MAKILSKFDEQQLIMANYACGFNQSETGKYSEWIIISNVCVQIWLIGGLKIIYDVILVYKQNISPPPSIPTPMLFESSLLFNRQPCLSLRCSLSCHCRPICLDAARHHASLQLWNPEGSAPHLNHRVGNPPGSTAYLNRRIGIVTPPPPPKLIYSTFTEHFLSNLVGPLWH